jgi:glycerate dehydrogenase
MNSTVFLNAARLDFDGRLDFSPLSGLTEFTRYADSSDDEIPARVEGQTIVITKELPLGRELIDRFPPSVRLICEAGTGYNNIDIAAARSRGIGVCNVPSYSTDGVAQLAITFMLNLSASLVQQQTMLRRGNLDNFFKSLQLPHFELNGKTLGVIGFGEIGRRVIAIARLLGMRIIVHSRTPRPGVEPGVSFVSLEELLRQSDFVSLHCPLNDATRHMINAERLALMKPTAFIINTSRGPLINEPDLIDALTRGTIAGAGLDVQEQEPPQPESQLYSLENVILTPHIGWKRLETRQRLIGLTAANIASFIKGAPVNVVN